MLPIFKLVGSHVNGAAADLAKPHVAIAGFKFAIRVAHWRRPIATPAGLMKHQWSVLARQALDQVECGVGCQHAFNHGLAA